MREVVLMVYHLTTGDLAYDYAPRRLCETLRLMTQAHGNLVELELQDGSKLRATRIECRPVEEIAAGS